MNQFHNPKRRILVVDDEPSVCHSVCLLLTHFGYDVATALSSIEALSILDREVRDLVVTDYTMPGMKGDELSALIKQRWPETSVVMLTACAGSLRAAARPLPDVDALLDKPFEVGLLRSTIEEVLAHKGQPTHSEPAPPPAPV